MGRMAENDHLIHPPTGANFFGCGSRFRGNSPGNPGSREIGREISREIREITREIPRGISRGIHGVAFPGKRISRDTSRGIPRLSQRMSSPGEVYFESRGIPRETHLPGHFQTNVISSIVQGKGASPFPVSAELPGQ